MATLAAAVVEVLTIRTVVVATAAQALAFAMLFSMISTVQPVFDLAFGRVPRPSPLWFAGIAAFAASRQPPQRAAGGASGDAPGSPRRCWGCRPWRPSPWPSSLWSGVLGPGGEFAIYVAWTASLFLLVGLTMGNLNALAMEPLGHIAGLAASVIGAVATVGAVVIAAPLGLAFDGTPLPVTLGVGACAGGAFGLLHLLRDPAPARA